MTIDTAARPSLVRRLLAAVLRFGVLPVIGAAPILGLGAIVGAILVMVLLGWISPDGVFIWGLGVLAISALAAMGLVIAFVLVWFRATRPVAVGYFIGTVVAVAVNILIFALVPALADALSLASNGSTSGVL